MHLILSQLLKQSVTKRHDQNQFVFDLVGFCVMHLFVLEVIYLHYQLPICVLQIIHLYCLPFVCFEVHPHVI